MAKTITFYEDKEKTIKAYPEIDPNGKYPGVSVGLADNLICEDGTGKSEESFLFRSTAGNTSVSNGPAKLENLKGNAQSTSIPEFLTYNLYAEGVKRIGVDIATFRGKKGSKGSYRFSYVPEMTFESSPSGLVTSINKIKFSNKVNNATGDYTFAYEVGITPVDNKSIIQTFNSLVFAEKVNYIPEQYTFTMSEDGNWYLGHEMISLVQYGISLNGQQESGDIITINYTANFWKYGEEIISLPEGYGVYTKGVKPGDTITIHYTKNCWKLDNEEVSLANYGISILNGGAMIEDIIEIVYQPQETGVVTVAYPKTLRTTGRNQFNIKGNQILEGYSIGDYGSIVSLENSYVIYFKCLGGHTYTISNEDGIEGMVAAYSAQQPTTLTTNMTILNLETTGSDTSAPTLINNSTRAHYKANSDGYMCIATKKIEKLCCALTWSAPVNKEGIWEPYWDASLPIPYTDAKGITISTYGLAAVDGIYDEIDFQNDKYYQRIERVVYSNSELVRIQNLGITPLFDNKYIYYPLTTPKIYSLKDFSSYYLIDDFGTEEFEGSALPLTASIYHTVNLKDKIRRDVEVLSNKTNYNYDNTNTYPSSSALWNVGASIWQALGLNVDTYDETVSYGLGSYVVHNHSLYKCISAGVGGLTGVPASASIASDPNSVISTFTGSTFINSDFVRENGIGEYTVRTWSYQTPGGHTDFVSEITAPNGKTTEVSSVGGVTESGTKGTATIMVSDEHWTKSYLFKA